eukprot:COSAG06_NODE_46655_length_345_cov_0.817073_1_plen_80_part_10
MGGRAQRVLKMRTRTTKLMCAPSFSRPGVSQSSCLARSSASHALTLARMHGAQVERAAASPQAHPTSAALYSLWRTADID